mmetsp:Transcript_36257/g.90525  ORF Transcript_36257/g.90525 Transcript_36257/m.90525 type:complete len:331 (-) Transcript_36257:263-1255(-)
MRLRVLEEVLPAHVEYVRHVRCGQHVLELLWYDVVELDVILDGVALEVLLEGPADGRDQDVAGNPVDDQGTRYRQGEVADEEGKVLEQLLHTFRLLVLGRWRQDGLRDVLRDDIDDGDGQVEQRCLPSERRIGAVPASGEPVECLCGVGTECGALEVGDPEEALAELAVLGEIGQAAIEAQENGNLHEGRQDGSQGVDLGLLVQLRRQEGLDLLVLAEALLDLLHHRVEGLDLLRALHLVPRYGEDEDADQHGEDDDGPAELGNAEFVFHDVVHLIDHILQEAHVVVPPSRLLGHLLSDGLDCLSDGLPSLPGSLGHTLQHLHDGPEPTG